jgi:hypothetical protein
MTGRYKAWRNLMVGAINAGLEQQVFGLRPGENWKLGSHYSFTLVGLHCTAIANDIGWDEISVHVAVNPRPSKKASLGCICGYGAQAAMVAEGHCDAWAGGWLERRNGTYLQSSSIGDLFRCRNAVKPILTDCAVEPNGYADNGKLHL